MKKVEAFVCDGCGRLFEPHSFRYEFYGLITEVSNTKRNGKMGATEADPLYFCDIKCLVERIDSQYTAHYK